MVGCRLTMVDKRLTKIKRTFYKVLTINLLEVPFVRLQGFEPWTL